MTYGVYPGPPGPPGPGVAPLYGSFTGNLTQAIPVGGTLLAALDTTEASNGITRGATSVIVPVAGVYLYNFSCQLIAGGNARVSLWLVVAGAPLARSNSDLDLAGSARHQLPFVEFMLPLNAGDTIELALSTTAACSLSNIAPQVGPARPSTPAVIVNCHRIA